MRLDDGEVPVVRDTYLNLCFSYLSVTYLLTEYHLRYFTDPFKIRSVPFELTLNPDLQN